MSSENAEKLVAEGIEALANEDHQLALNSLERALQLERTPLTGSCLAYCLAKVRENYSEAIPLAREAVDREPENPLHYYNLGRVLSLSGDREQALTILRKGMEHGMHFELLREMQSIVIRKPPVFKMLPRKHFLNKYAGLILSRLGLR